MQLRKNPINDNWLQTWIWKKRKSLKFYRHRHSLNLHSEISRKGVFDFIDLLRKKWRKPVSHDPETIRRAGFHGHCCGTCHRTEGKRSHDFETACLELASVLQCRIIAQVVGMRKVSVSVVLQPSVERGWITRHNLWPNFNFCLIQFVLFN